MQQYIRALQSEWLKLKGSGTLWLLLAASGFIPVLLTIVTLSAGNEFTTMEKNNPWPEFMKNVFVGFSTFFYPLFMVLIVVRMSQVEFKGGGWKIIETQPVKKRWLYLAKFNWALVLSLFTLLLLLLWALLGGAIVSMVKPLAAFGKFSPEWKNIFSFMIRDWIAAMGMMALQLLISIWIPNLIANIGIGLIGIIAGGIFSGFGKGDWFPYAIPSFTALNMSGSATGSYLLHFEWQSILWMIVFLIAGYQYFINKGWKPALFKPAIKLVYWLVMVVLLGIAMNALNRPVQLPTHGKTVICGFTKGLKNNPPLVLYQPLSSDTLLVVPVKDGRFCSYPSQNIPQGIYYFRMGKYSSQVFFGNGDSLFLELKINNEVLDMRVQGNRVAENSYLLQKGEPEGNFFLENNVFRYKPGEYASMVLSNWEDANKKIEDFKTVDNIRPANDFITLMKKISSVNYLRYLDVVYPKMFSVNFPNDSLRYPSITDKLRKTLNATDTGMLTHQQYRDFLSLYYREQFRKNKTDKTPFFSDYLNSQNIPHRIKDAVLYDEAKDVMSRTRDSVIRNQQLLSYTKYIQDQKLITQLESYNQLLKLMQRGMPAYNFAAENLAGKTIHLSDLRGRYVLMDVWATWCGPCKEQTPYFEDFAKTYYEKIAFVSVSVDEDRNAWYNKSADYSNQVLQLWGTQDAGFSRGYNIEFIPRFILIDPNGRIENAQMPRPSEPEFEEVLKKEVGL